MGLSSLTVKKCSTFSIRRLKLRLSRVGAKHEEEEEEPQENPAELAALQSLKTKKKKKWKRRWRNLEDGRDAALWEDNEREREKR